jgi:tRNA pseudouridine55 synthase
LSSTPIWPAGFWLPIHKPVAFTSHDVVAKSRGILKIRKIGHSGTLDPDVTGVLLLAVGKATRLIQYLPGEKVYRGTFRLGITTDSQDASGQILAEKPVPAIALAELETALAGFMGLQSQLPPMVSAVSYQGQRLYQLARKGIEITERPSREITIHSIIVLDWNSPDLTLEVRCSAGTYMRTLAHDLGQKLGCGAHLLKLCRIEANGIQLNQTIPLLEVTPEPDKLPLLAMDSPLAHLKALQLSSAESQRFKMGQLFQPKSEGSFAEPLKIYDSGQFIGMGKIDPSERLLRSLCVLEPQLSLELA